MVGGILAFALSLTPSLLPRTALFQGLVTGLSTAAGYGAGALVDSAATRVARWAGLRVQLRPGVSRGLRYGWAGLLGLVLVVSPVVALRQQQDLARVFDQPEPGGGHALVSGLVAAVVFGLVVLLWLGVERLYRWLLTGLRRLPGPLPSILASATVVLLVVGAVQYPLLGGVLRVVGGNERAANASIPAGMHAPTRPTLSGSPDSLEAWESLGHEGRRFVSSAPSAERIRAATGRDAQDPVRVYAAVAEDRTIPETTDAAIAELDRTDAWSRSTIVVLTTTGRGWVNPWTVLAPELLTDGDIASVAIQHSNLPSPLAFVDAPSTPVEAGQSLTSAVLERVEAMPKGERPRVFVSGESLGAYGGDAAFGSVDDLLRRVDGAVFTGAPLFTENRASLTAERQGGSTEVNPVIDNGTHVRFASEPGELTADQYGRDLGEWRSPRVAYLQHRSDPVAWWSPRLAFSEPDWLREDREGTTTASMTWLPVITFWQVTADLAVAMEAPPGTGHVYRADVVPAWAGVLGEDPAADYSAIVEAITAR